MLNWDTRNTSTINQIDCGKWKSHWRNEIQAPTLRFVFSHPSFLHLRCISLLQQKCVTYWLFARLDIFSASNAKTSHSATTFSQAKTGNALARNFPLSAWTDTNKVVYCRKCTTVAKQKTSKSNENEKPEKKPIEIYLLIVKSLLCVGLTATPVNFC